MCVFFFMVNKHWISNKRNKRHFNSTYCVVSVVFAWIWQNINTTRNVKFDSIVNLSVLSYFTVILLKLWHNWCYPWRKYVHNWRNVFIYLTGKEMLSFKYKYRMSAKPSCTLQPHCLFHKVNFPPLHSSVPVVFSTFFLVIQQSLRPARSKPTNVYSLAGEEKADFIPELRSGW